MASPFGEFSCQRHYGGDQIKFPYEQDIKDFKLMTKSTVVDYDKMLVGKRPSTHEVRGGTKFISHQQQPRTPNDQLKAFYSIIGITYTGHS